MERSFDPTDPESFEGLFENTFGRDIGALSDDELVAMYSVFQHHASRMLSLMGERGMIGAAGDVPVIPYHLPKGVADPATVLNGGQPLPAAH